MTRSAPEFADGTDADAGVRGASRSARRARFATRPAGAAVPDAPAVARPADGFVRAFARGLDVIRAFDGRPRRMTLTEVAEAAGLSRAGARRILLTMAALGYVDHDGRTFALTARILSLGFAYLTSLPFWNLAAPVMEDLVLRLRESCSAAVLDGREIVYVARVPTQKIMTINLAIGSRLPAYCTSMGRVLLAGLDPADAAGVLRASDLRARTPRTETGMTKLRTLIDETRRKGWSLVDQELEEGLISMAVPIVDAGGRTIAAMNVSGQANRTPAREMQRRFLAPLADAARRISATLAMAPSSTRTAHGPG